MNELNRENGKEIEMRQLEDIKILKGRSPDITLDSIQRLEEEIGYKLPSSYIKLLLHSNGGHPELDTFYCENGEWSVNNFFFVGTDDTSEESVVWNYYHKPPRTANSLLPFARDGGGNLFCLDLSRGEKAPVLILIHDISTENIQELAETFDVFIEGLQENLDYI